ncbi:MAG: protein-L-isoaspartate(D-aspartate) O-methyltransferase [Deltaproteobacteria bacterium]|nr:protein-L-isoaspartate(D-aspartate) O-methyltransferase [Candidatus Zymogenaceae bacterium]
MAPVDEYSISAQRMVSNQIESRGIRDERVLDAFRRVPRYRFVEDALRGQAYNDHPLPIGSGQTISQPYIVALMTEALELSGTESVLEIGTGSGYQTAILAELAGHVYSIERIEKLAKRSKGILEELGYTNITIKVDDGTQGWREYAPFDAIIVTAASPDVPSPLVDQLSDGGSLVIPVGGRISQELVKITRKGNGTKRTHMGDCRFVKLIGEHGWKN